VQPTAPIERSSIGSEFVGRGPLIFLVVLLGVGAAVTLAQLWIFWPTALEATGSESAAVSGGLPPQKEVHYLGLAEFTLSTEVLFFIIVGLAGALGGLIHALRSLMTYVGTRTLRWSWVPYYLLLPLVGVLGSTLFYVILRAGLFSPSTEVDQASPFGFAAVAGLVGLFSEQAMLKLRDLAGQLFTPAASSIDHFEAEEPTTTTPGGQAEKP
jgi:hypothetical protein